jgi:tetratricopeptide (TPR) repeat protein
LTKLNRYEQAEELALVNLNAARELYGDPDEHQLPHLMSLAFIRKGQGRFQEQLQVLEEALAICEERLPPDHHRTFLTRMGMASASFSLNDWERAEELLRSCLEHFRRTLGDEHPESFVALNNLSNVLLMQKRPAEAVVLIEQAVPLAKKLYGERNHMTVSALSNLANVYRKLDRPGEAEATCRQALDVARGILPEDHDVVLRLKSILGPALADQSRLTDAEEVLLPAWQASGAALGPEHPLTLALLADLTHVQSLAGDWEALARYAVELHERGQASGRYVEWSAEMLEKARAALAVAEE